MRKVLNYKVSKLADPCEYKHRRRRKHRPRMFSEKRFHSKWKAIFIFNLHLWIYFFDYDTFDILDLHIQRYQFYSPTPFLLLFYIVPTSFFPIWFYLYPLWASASDVQFPSHATLCSVTLSGMLSLSSLMFRRYPFDASLKSRQQQLSFIVRVEISPQSCQVRESVHVCEHERVNESMNDDKIEGADGCGMKGGEVSMVQALLAVSSWLLYVQVYSETYLTNMQTNLGTNFTANGLPILKQIDLELIWVPLSFKWVNYVQSDCTDTFKYFLLNETLWIYSECSSWFRLTSWEVAQSSWNACHPVCA